MDVEQSRKIFLENFWCYNHFAKEDLVEMGIPKERIEAFTDFFHKQFGDEMDELFSTAVNDFIDDEED